MDIPQVTGMVELKLGNRAGGGGDKGLGIWECSSSSQCSNWRSPKERREPRQVLGRGGPWHLY